MGALRTLLLHVPSSLLLAPLIFGLAWLWPGLGNSWFSGIEAWFQSLARRRILTAILLALLPLVLRLTVLPSEGVPIPRVEDEFEHLLVADTLLHGRLANPPHSNPDFFEAVYVLQRPAYSSIYPIGIGISLAIGRLLFGHPWGGVLLFVSLMCAGVYWMLLNWVSPGWALIGGVIAIMSFGPTSNWTNSYWCGGAAAFAGCLIFGALPRLIDNSQAFYGLVLGLGLSYAFLIRPFETILAAPCLVIFGFLYRHGISWVHFRPKLMFVALGLVPGVLITALHNHAVTGKYSELPYALSRIEYGVPQTLSFQRAAVPEHALTPEQTEAYEFQKKDHDSIATLSGWAGSLPGHFSVVRAYLGIALTPLLLVLPFCRFDRQLGWILSSIGLVIVGGSFYAYSQSHYVAPIIGIFFLLGIVTMKRLNEFRWGRTAVRLFLTLAICHFITLYALFAAGNSIPAITGKHKNLTSNADVVTSDPRSRIIDRLRRVGGDHLVFVKYVGHNPRHIQWIHNRADVDSSRIIWARDLGTQADMHLIQHYPSRAAWRVDTGLGEPALTRLR
ncbi:MAG TPA: hypothetical protein VN788_10715 [Verrucomicrobiae bacterium]|nr:hypothetical protein [Verrucomicrobiae bacterium]